MRIRLHLFAFAAMEIPMLNLSNAMLWWWAR